jgi:hypothetical protein
MVMTYNDFEGPVKESPFKEIRECLEFVEYGKTPLFYNPNTGKFYTGSIVEQHVRFKAPLVALDFPLSEDVKRTHAMPGNYDEILAKFHGHNDHHKKVKKEDPIEIGIPELSIGDKINAENTFIKKKVIPKLKKKSK